MHARHRRLRGALRSHALRAHGGRPGSERAVPGVGGGPCRGGGSCGRLERRPRHSRSSAPRWRGAARSGPAVGRARVPVDDGERWEPSGRAAVGHGGRGRALQGGLRGERVLGAAPDVHNGLKRRAPRNLQHLLPSVRCRQRRALARLYLQCARARHIPARQLPVPRQRLRWHRRERGLASGARYGLLLRHRFQRERVGAGRGCDGAGVAREVPAY
mmetsp:Transcript_28354/g.67196  ORF Transcript_28354/g.67196 Transcript_28354/m.67196 type:complete len:216 (-) Transcript_28354:461-1108(-)